jgi:Putative lumazine-binding
MRPLALAAAVLAALAGIANLAYPNGTARAESAVHAPASASDSAVRATVGRYLHGLRFNDTTSFHAAFWPDARLLWVRRDGSLGQLTQAEWYRGFANSAGQEEKGDLQIASVDVSGDVATARVVETYATETYVDYLSLVRVGAEWRIVNKVYTRAAR